MLNLGLLSLMIANLWYNDRFYIFRNIRRKKLRIFTIFSTYFLTSAISSYFILED